MAFFRQYVAPFIALAVFLLALVAVSARIFLPTDMAAPAPVEQRYSPEKQAQTPIPTGEAVQSSSVN